MTNETITPNTQKVSIEEAVRMTIEAIRSKANDDELFTKWLYGQVTIPYHRFSRLALDQRGRMIRRVKSLAEVSELSENDFAPVLKKVSDEFFNNHLSLYYTAKFYFSM